MNIAITWDHRSIFPFREGVTLYMYYVVISLLKNYPDIIISFIVYPHNVQELKKCFTEEDNNKYAHRITYHIPNPSLLERVYIMGLKVFFSLVYFCTGKARYKGQGIVNSVLAKSILKSDIVRTPPDIVFVPFVRLPLGLKIPCPKVVQVHDLYTIVLRDLFCKDNKFIDRSNNEIISIYADYAKQGATFVSSTQYTIDSQILKYIPSIDTGHTCCIPFPPMLKENISINKDEIKVVQNKYGITKPYIFYASKIRPNKNIFVLLRAILRLKNEGTDILMVTTGNMDSLNSVKNFTSRNPVLDNIIQTGSISTEELVALYKGATMVVVPTIIEGYGMSGQGLEAMKLGIPVIHAKSMGMTESLASVGLNFDTADLNWFEYDDDCTLAQKIREVLINPETHIKKQYHILEAYTKISWDDVAHKYYQLFQKLAVTEF